MAGGMGRRERYGTMAERVAATRRNQERMTTGPDTDSSAPAEPVEEAAAPPDLRHCWYAGPHGRQAALLVEWRQVSPEAGWEGYIAVAAPDAEGWGIVTMWVDAGLLEKA